MHKIDINKEITDSYKLAYMIGEDGWIDDNTIIVNCSPDYSSIVCQIVNHTLSSFNNNELHEMITLEMPYPTMSQIWNSDSKQWELFSRYLPMWVNKLDKNYKYLFIDSAVIRGKNFFLLKSAILGKIDYKLASLYVDESSILIPDYYIEKASQVIFSWENPANPNWNY